MAENLLEIKDLVIQFKTKKGILTAVDHVNFNVRQGEILGLVGESGCGKSVTSMQILGLNPKESTLVPQGEILFEGRDLLRLSPRQMRSIRGEEISMIFQDSLTGLDPVIPIGKIMVEGIRAHHKEISRQEAYDKAVKVLESVGIPSPEKRMHEYAHELSGGMRQRVMIGLSLFNDTKLLIADEPTTALDVTIQAQILELLRKRQRERGNSMILITHDMGVVAEMTDRVAVMYAGIIVEMATTREIYTNARHPYTQGLLQSIPKLDQPDDQRLYMIEGTVPPLGQRGSGCPFANRCRYATEQCRASIPEPVTDASGHMVRCHHVAASAGTATEE